MNDLTFFLICFGGIAGAIFFVLGAVILNANAQSKFYDEMEKKLWGKSE